MMLQITFIAISIISLLIFYNAVGQDKRVLLFGIFWMAIVGAAGISGYFQNTRSWPPRFLWVIVAATCLCIITYRSVRHNKTDIRYLFAIHILRLPVELVLYELYLRKQIPVEMTFQGWNFDIVMGLSAGIVPIYYGLSKKRPGPIFLIVWNVAGIILLSTIVIIAVLSSPLPFQQLAFDQRNVAVLAFPFVLLPSVIVPIVFLSHFLILRNYVATAYLTPNPRIANE